MRSLEIVKYENIYKSSWDDFISTSKNGTFLFYRDYMEYHSDRYHDHSLMVYSDTGKLLAVMPANIRGDTLHSHEGLSFGGIILDLQIRLEIFMELSSALLSYLRNLGVKEVIYKAIPYIYHRLPSDEDLYALFNHNAVLYRRDVNSVLFMGNMVPYQTLRKRTLSKAKMHGIIVEKSEDYMGFMGILEQVLMKRHGLEPVHTFEEISLLARRFPENIKLFTASGEGGLKAGVIIYEHDHVAHAQYTANSEEGMKIGALDPIFDFLIKDYYKDKRYISFGVSSEKEGKYLNKGLVAYKEGFGARTLAHDFYKICF
ncbi:MAG: GNAT family N-acetyltransferase [Desulforudis sp.]|jgi:hypothetical protein|nr:MAG: GNAT family N-acetyltransferase [Desulforudis sp.]